MATMSYAAGLVVSQILGWSEFAAIDGAIGVVVMVGTLLAVIGGMRAVIWTDAAQFFVLFGGVVSMVVASVWFGGGFGETIARAADAGKFDPPPLASFSGFSILSALMLGFFSYLSGAGTDQVLLQTYLSAKSDKEAKKSLIINGFFLKPLSLIFPLLGLFLFTYYAIHPEVAALMRVPDDAVPVFVRHVLPIGLRGIILAAILSAVVDSLASGLAAWSACTQVDFIKRWQKRSWSDRFSVLIGRLLVVLGGITVLVSALFVRRIGENSNIIEVLNVVMYPFAGVLLGIVLLGLLTLRATPGGTLIGAVIGFATVLSTPLASRVVGLIEGGTLVPSEQVTEALRFLADISSFYSAGIGASVTFIAGYLFSFLFRAPQAEKVDGLTLHTRPSDEGREVEPQYQTQAQQSAQK